VEGSDQIRIRDVSNNKHVERSEEAPCYVMLKIVQFSPPRIKYVPEHVDLISRS
jgi:hypothetical protein